MNILVFILIVIYLAIGASYGTDYSSEHPDANAKDDILCFLLLIIWPIYLIKNLNKQ